MIFLYQCKYFSHSLHTNVVVIKKKILSILSLTSRHNFLSSEMKTKSLHFVFPKSKKVRKWLFFLLLYGGYTTWKNWPRLLSISVKEIVHLIILWVLAQHWKILSMNPISTESLLPCQRLKEAGIWRGLQGALINWAKITGKFVLSKQWKLSFPTVLQAQPNFKLTTRYVLKIFVWHVI